MSSPPMKSVENVCDAKVKDQKMTDFIPNWINLEYFIPILQRNESDFLEVLDFQSRSATVPGENYSSIMLRILIKILLKDGKQREISYILKTDDACLPFTQLTNFFLKEKLMYANHLPKIEAIYKNIDWQIKFNPKCLHLDDRSKYIAIVLEDLKQRQFSIIDMRKGFDLLHMKAVLGKLAEFHAASAKYVEINGTQVLGDIFLEGILTDDNFEAISGLQFLNREMFLKALPLWHLGTDTGKYLAAFPSAEDYSEENRYTCKVNQDDFNVLNHGDCRSNNIMFRYSAAGEIEETIFIDFQTSKWGSPAQDLWYLIITSAAEDIRVREFDHFIQIYHERLLECLKALNYGKPMPTLRDCHQMMIRDAFWGMFAFHTILPVILLPGNADASVDNMMKPGPEGDKFRFDAFMNPDYVTVARQLCPFLFSKGAFEITFNRQ